MLQVDEAALYIREEKSIRFVLSAVNGKISAPDAFELTEHDLELLQTAGNLQRQTSQSLTGELGHSLDLKTMGLQIAQAVEMEGEIRGLLVLGDKRNHTPYSAEDYAFLQALSQIANIGLHNLKAQDEMVHLNEEMQSKMDRIGEQRRQISLLQAELESLRTGGKTQVSTKPMELLSRDKMIGRSPAMDNVMRMVSKVSRSESSVLIRGESGTGKEVLAEIFASQF